MNAVNGFVEEEPNAIVLGILSFKIILMVSFFWFLSLNRFNDYLIESTFALTRTEQMCSNYGFKLFTLSELTLSIACFRAFGNFRLCSSSGINN